MSSTPDPAQTPDPAPEPKGPDLGVVWHHAKQLGPVVGALAVLALTAPALVGFAVLFGSVIGPARIRDFLESLGVGAPFAAAALFALLTGMALAPTYAFSFAAGAIFHSFPVAAGVAMFGVTVGGIIGYVIGTIIARRRVMEVIDASDRARVIRAALLDRGILTETFIITLIRIPPNSPFALTNFTLSAARANPIAYLLGTAIGIAPRTLFAVWIGVQIGDVTRLDEARPRAFIIGGVVVAIVVFVVLYRLFTRWAREALDRHLEHAPVTPPEAD